MQQLQTIRFVTMAETKRWWNPKFQYFHRNALEHTETRYETLELVWTPIRKFQHYFFKQFQIQSIYFSNIFETFRGIFPEHEGNKICMCYKWYLSVKRLTILWGNDHSSDFEFQTSQSSSTYFWAHNRHARAGTEGLGSFFSFSATNISVKGSTNNVPGPPYSLCRNSLSTWIPQKKLIIETNFCKSFH